MAAVDFDPTKFGLPGNTDQVATNPPNNNDNPADQEFKTEEQIFSEEMVRFLEQDLDKGDGEKPAATEGEQTLTEQEIAAASALTQAAQALEGQSEQPEPSVEGGEPEAEQIDFNSLVTRLYGRPFTQEELTNFIFLANDLNRLDPQQRQTLNEALYGGGVQQPQQQYQQPQPQQQQYPTTQIPNAPAPVLPTDVDPDIAAALNPMLARMEQIQQQNQALTQYVLQQEQQSQINRQQMLQSQYANAKNAWMNEESRKLTDEDKLAIDVQLRNTNILPHFLAISNGDGTAAMNQALEYLYWADPKLRAREIESQANKSRIEAGEQARKKAVSTGLTAGGGAAGSPPQTAQTNGQNGNSGDPMAQFLAPYFPTR